MVLALLLALAQAVTPLTGVVSDTNGEVIVGATVIVRTASGGEQRTVTDGEGRFTIASPPASGTVIVRAPGFAVAQQPLGAGEATFTLQPASVLESVVVTATRTERRLGTIPASVNVVTSETIKASPAVIADDILRQIPSFSLFRRTSAIAAQPTTQGVSLRGIGPSGQSRTLVLLDGVPFNDPFGGWVYWTRVPLLSVDQIEITEDTASSLYGNIAMGGVIHIVTQRPSPRTVQLQTQYGSRSTPKVDLFASDRWGRFGATVEASAFDTKGFPIVAPRERGPIDNNADVQFTNVAGKIEFDPSDRLHTFVRLSRFSEDRTNAKVGEVNGTTWQAGSAGLQAQLPDNSTVQAHTYVDRQRSKFNFLAVTNASTTRTAVRLATDQRVPTNGVGGMVQWTKVFGTAHVVSAGTDYRWVDGDSEEDAYVAAVPIVTSGVTQQARLNLQRISGGTQRSMGVFVSDIITPTSKLVLTLSARADRWRNYDGHNLETTVATGLPTANYRDDLPDRSDTVFSPRVAALYHFTDRVTAWGAVNSGFRAPTLTELYRQFQVGAVLTRPNSDLGPERLVGGELGLNLAPAKNLTARVTLFDNRVKNPVSNVTLTPNLVQKQNLGKTRIRGVQTDVEYRITPELRVAGAYLYNEAKVTDGGGANEDLVGLFLAQVPEHRGSVQVSWADARFATVAVSVQFQGRQFNDDRNINFIPPETLTEAGYDADFGVGLPGFTSVDVSASRSLGRSLEIFVGAQNLFDTAYFVQTNPSTLGTPRLVNAGLRVRFAGR
ncbi:MAG: TonB-dependent receptor [Acidobacteria bacterium]|nr:TonB-dependent receptor [Acidobacteriota bacterium]